MICAIGHIPATKGNRIAIEAVAASGPASRFASLLQNQRKPKPLQAQRRSRCIEHTATPTQAQPTQGSALAVCRSGFSREPHRARIPGLKVLLHIGTRRRPHSEKWSIFSNTYRNSETYIFISFCFIHAQRTRPASVLHRLRRCFEPLRCSTALLRCSASTAGMIKISPSMQLKASCAELSNTNAEAVCPDAAAPVRQR